MKIRLAGILAVGLLTNTALLHAQHYNIADLGSLSGDSSSTAEGMNSAGQAAGTSFGLTTATATLFSGGTAISLGALGASDSSFGEAVNASDEVAGYDMVGSGSSAVAHAFLYANGKMKDIHSASLFPYGTLSVGINLSGEVVGYGWINTVSTHPFLYSGGRMIDLGTLGGASATALAINDAGTVVGWSLTAGGVQHAFLYSNGKMTDLGVPSGANGSIASAINRTGQIGGSLGVNTASHAALYNQGVWTDLGVVTGTIANQAT